MPPPLDPLARVTPAGVEARPDAVRVRWQFDNLPTADDLDLSLTFAAALRLADSDADRRLFAEHFLTRDQVVGAGVVRDHLAAALRTAAESSARQTSADEALADAGRLALQQTLAAAARAAGFAAGVEILAPFELTADSPALRRRRTEEQARRRDEEADADRAARLRRAGGLAAEFAKLRAAAPDLDPGALLERLAPADRPAVYAAVAGESASSGGSVYAVSGSVLLQIDTTNADAPPRRIDLPAALGPARSVQFDEYGDLLIGGRNGVAVVDPADPDAAKLSSAPDGASDLGYNAAVLADGLLWATHSDFGLLGWTGDRPDAPAVRLTVDQLARGSAAGPKHLIDLGDGRVAAACGGQMFTAHAETPPQPVALPDGGEGDPIIGLVKLAAGPFEPADGVAVVRRSGALLILDADLKPTAERRHAGPLAAARALPWAGSTRLLLTREDGGLEAVGLCDSVVTTYGSPHRGFRAIAADARAVAAVSPDRQRVVLWDAADGRAPTREIHVTSITRHRVADVAVG